MKTPLTALVGAIANPELMADTRLILAVRDDMLSASDGLGDGSAFVRMGGDEAISVLAAAGRSFGDDAPSWFAPRNALEVDARFRQIIPYVVLRCGDDFLTYTRGVAGGEARLHDRISMGFGGHVDIPDAVTGQDGAFDMKETLTGSVRRELDEEIPGIVVTASEWVGLVVDSSNDVGRVHVGLIGIFDIEAAPETSGESEIANLALMSREALLAESGRLENWSRILIENI